ncbi:MAG: VWA domain-containing protein [Pyrinomonadaceae bacterium]
MVLRDIFQLLVRTLHRLYLCHLAILIGVPFVLAVGITSAQPPTKPAPTPPTTTDPDDAPLKIQTDLVTLTLTVQDTWGRVVSSLAKKHFSVFEDGVEQEISFFEDVDAPASIGIIYDVSGSMGGGKIGRSRRALERFMLTSHPSDEFSLITFSDKVQLLADRTRDINAVLDKLTLVKPGGNTAFYDGVYLGADRVMRGSHNKKALLIISDGVDNNSRYTFNEMRRFLKESDVIIYGIGIYGNGDGGGEGALTRLAESTGGRAFYPGLTDGSFDEICERIALELRHQYSIGYVPKDFHQDGKWRRLKVKVNPPRGMPRLAVRAREGYFATPLIPNK